jgi:leucyl/phenylalanyl-tRNA---protein transferase
MSKTLPPANELLWSYSQGFFPMPEPQTEEIEWYRPDPRAILPVDKFHVSRSLRKVLRETIFSVTHNRDFTQVISGCANRAETWINSEFIRAYTELHRLGHAHSVEVWLDEKIVGGVYGVQLGGAFFAESMFSTKDNASKVALYDLTTHLRRQGFALLEIQFLTPHLASLGAIEIPDGEYQTILKKAQKVTCHF